MPTFKSNIVHFADMQKKLLGADGALDDIHPPCDGCVHLMYWDRLERIAIALESLASSVKPSPSSVK